MEDDRQEIVDGRHEVLQQGNYQPPLAPLAPLPAGDHGLCCIHHATNSPTYLHARHLSAHRCSGCQLCVSRCMAQPAQHWASRSSTPGNLAKAHSGACGLLPVHVHAGVVQRMAIRRDLSLALLPNPTYRPLTGPLAGPLAGPGVPPQRSAPGSGGSELSWNLSQLDETATNLLYLKGFPCGLMHLKQSICGGRANASLPAHYPRARDLGIITELLLLQRRRLAATQPQ